eukprot:scpid106183/ scgid32681/ 
MTSCGGEVRGTSSTRSELMKRFSEPASTSASRRWHGDGWTNRARAELAQRMPGGISELRRKDPERTQARDRTTTVTVVPALRCSTGIEREQEWGTGSNRTGHRSTQCK